MKIACIGGGPAGLYLGILVKRSAPKHDVVVYERNRAAETFGFGVVFSDATLGHLAAADPETHAAITRRFARWDDIEIHVGGEVLRSTGHGFCGIERKLLLQILQTLAAELGVRVEYEHAITQLGAVADADVVVACDGAASWVRESLAAELRPHVDVRPNKFVWLGCTVPYQAFTFLFKPTRFGLFRVHAYRFADGLSIQPHRPSAALPTRAEPPSSTFIVECRDETWRAAGLADADEDATVATLSAIFADELGGHRLIKNRSIWRNFPTVRCGTWHTDNVVLLGDAAHTAHFSIGSGTKLAMEDAIALRDELLARPGDTRAALAAYEARRRPEVEALQAAAQASLEWFEGTERYTAMTPAQFTYSLMTRSLRVSHASVGKRDPDLARGVERLLAATVGMVGEAPPPPTALRFKLGDRRAASRIAVAAIAPDASTAPPVDSDRSLAGDDQLVALGGAAAAGAGIVVTEALPVAADATRAGIATDEQAVAWRRIVDYVHGRGALIAARLAITTAATERDLEETVKRAAFAGFDMLVLDAARDRAAIEALPAAVQAARPHWRAGAWIAAVVDDLPSARAAVVGSAAQLVRAGAHMLWVTARVTAGATGARVPAAPLADRLRNELGVATALDGADATLSDLDATIAAGRADLIVVARVPPGFAPRRAP